MNSVSEIWWNVTFPFINFLVNIGLMLCCVILQLTQMFGLSALRALSDKFNVQTERNVCVVLGCIADKLAGPNSVAVLTDETLDYMLAFLVSYTESFITTKKCTVPQIKATSCDQVRRA